MTKQVHKPDLFIVGAPKSGTTSLYSYLAAHPDVYMAPVKEPMYFCPDVGPMHAHRLQYPADEARYLDLFSEAGAQARLGEATTRYLVSRRAPQLIADFQPHPYVVAMLRNPVEMIHALHNERFSKGNESIEDFERALAVDDERVEARRDQTDEPGPAGYRESASYADQLERWFSAVGRERVHVILFDDFAADTGAELVRVLNFLDVDASHKQASQPMRNASHRQRPIVRRVLDSAPAQRLVDDVLPALIGANAKARLSLRFRQSRLNRRAAPRAPLPAGLAARLRESFRPDIERVSTLLGRDLVALWLQPQINGGAG